MSRSSIYLRRALFGTSCAVVFGFGASQAFATPDQQAAGGSCRPTGYKYYTGGCLDPDLTGCPGVAYCDGYQTACVCEPPIILP